MHFVQKFGFSEQVTHSGEQGTHILLILVYIMVMVGSVEVEIVGYEATKPIGHDYTHT